MGAGIRHDLLNKRLYRQLKKLQRELAAEDFLFEYKQYSLRLRISEVYLDVRYRILRASNGEVAGLLRLTATNGVNGRVFVKEPCGKQDIINYAKGKEV